MLVLMKLSLKRGKWNLFKMFYLGLRIILILTISSIELNMHHQIIIHSLKQGQVQAKLIQWFQEWRFYVIRKMEILQI